MPPPKTDGEKIAFIKTVFAIMAAPRKSTADVEEEFLRAAGEGGRLYDLKKLLRDAPADPAFYIRAFELAVVNNRYPTSVWLASHVEKTLGAGDFWRIRDALGAKGNAAGVRWLDKRFPGLAVTKRVAAPKQEPAPGTIPDWEELDESEISEILSKSPELIPSLGEGIRNDYLRWIVAHGDTEGLDIMLRLGFVGQKQVADIIEKYLDDSASAAEATLEWLSQNFHFNVEPGAAKNAVASTGISLHDTMRLMIAAGARDRDVDAAILWKLTDIFNKGVWDVEEFIIKMKSVWGERIDWGRYPTLAAYGAEAVPYMSFSRVDKVEAEGEKAMISSFGAEWRTAPTAKTAALVDKRLRENISLLDDYERWLSMAGRFTDDYLRKYGREVFPGKEYGKRSFPPVLLSLRRAYRLGRGEAAKPEPAPAPAVTDSPSRLDALSDFFIESVCRQLAEQDYEALTKFRNVSFRVDNLCRRVLPPRVKKFLSILNVLALGRGLIYFDDHREYQILDPADAKTFVDIYNNQRKAYFDGKEELKVINPATPQFPRK